MMSVGLVRNARDSDMIEICGSRGEEWPYVWGTIHCDGIGDALEGKLLNGNNGHPASFKELIECVIVSKDEWERLCSDLESSKRRIDELERDLEQALL
jgi:hypothetical protein